MDVHEKELIAEVYDWLKDLVNSSDTDQLYSTEEIYEISSPLLYELGKLLPEYHSDYEFTREK